MKIKTYGWVVCCSMHGLDLCTYPVEFFYTRAEARKALDAYRLRTVRKVRVCAD